MKKLILALFYLVSTLVQAEIQVQVNPSQISLGQTFRLTITQNNASTTASPDISVLQKEFIIVGSEQRSNYTLINGNMQSTNEWVFSLEPQKAGILTIPALAIGSEKSTPVTINVQQSKAPTTGHSPSPSQGQDVMIVTSVRDKKNYVNQEIRYLVKIYNSRRLVDAEFKPPQVEDALLFPLGQGKRYQTLHNNKDYVVEEQEYAIFPQKSGSMNIISPKLTAMIYDFESKRIKVQDNPIELTIIPAPKNYQGATWLPAKQMELTETYENTNQELSQGSTLVRNITIKAKAVPAQLLPPLHFDNSDAYRVYLEKGKEHNQVKGGELIGSTQIKLTYLFKKAGQATLPEVKLAWFNTQTGTEEIASLPPRSLNITTAGVASIPSDSTAQPQQTLASPPTSLVSPSVNSDWVWVLIGFLSLAWLTTLGLWWYQKRPKNQGRSQHKKALNELKKACKSCNPSKARDALLKWASLQWPDANLLNLSDITLLVRDAAFKKQILLLSEVLYKTQEKNLWRGDLLFKCVEAYKAQKSVKKTKGKGLPPINPVSL